MKLLILGTRGIPARHGGFETFAEKLAIFLVARSWEVVVYCQESGNGEIYESEWQGVRLIHIPIQREGASGTILFDWQVAKHAKKEKGLCLILGYNTAIFNSLQRFSGQSSIINMDGIEWQRKKWGALAKIWFWINERAGCWIGNHLVADHPNIKSHLATRVDAEKITIIPYGGDEVLSADSRILQSYGLISDDFSVVIARPEPENSFLEMVRAFSQKERSHKLVVLGNFQPKNNSYHNAVMQAASNEVIFPGAIYDTSVVQALRFGARFYLHGHQVGGTNPSLVEAMGANCAIIAHDNRFNRWVAKDGAVYFKDEITCSLLFDQILNDFTRIETMKINSKARFNECFTWQQVLQEYEKLLVLWHSSI